MNAVTQQLLWRYTRILMGREGRSCAEVGTEGWWSARLGGELRSYAGGNELPSPRSVVGCEKSQAARHRHVFVRSSSCR